MVPAQVDPVDPGGTFNGSFTFQPQRLVQCPAWRRYTKGFVMFMDSLRWNSERVEETEVCLRQNLGPPKLGHGPVTSQGLGLISLWAQLLWWFSHCLSDSGPQPPTPRVAQVRALRGAARASPHIL